MSVSASTWHVNLGARVGFRGFRVCRVSSTLNTFSSKDTHVAKGCSGLWGQPLGMKAPVDIQKRNGGPFVWPSVLLAISFAKAKQICLKLDFLPGARSVGLSCTNRELQKSASEKLPGSSCRVCHANRSGHASPRGLLNNSKLSWL